MFRELNPAGAEYPQYKITIQPGNAGLQNIPDLQAPVAFLMDSSTKTATMAGSVPAASLLRGAIYGVFVNAQAVIDAAKFTTTVPAPAGITLWSQAEMSRLAAQGAPWIVAAQSFQLPLGPPYQCVTTSPGYTSCAGSSEILNFAYMLLS